MSQPPSVMHDASGALLAAPSRIDPFALFGLPRRAWLDVDALRPTYLTLSRAVHPDRFASASAEQKTRARDWSALLNGAYATLRNHPDRILAAIQAPTPAAAAKPPAKLLSTVFEIREAIEEAGSGAPNAAQRAILDAHLADVRKQVTASEADLRRHAESWDQSPSASSEQALRALLDELSYLNKLVAEIGAVLARKS